MKAQPPFAQWQLAWGTPGDLITSGHKRMLDAAFVLALAFHAGIFWTIWRDQLQKKLTGQATATLQSVDLIEPEPEVAPPPPVVQKPKSAFDFIKMALPIFRKPPPVEAPRDIAVTPKIQEPKIAEPEKLIEKKLPSPSLAPEIKLDARKAPQAPKIMDARIPSARTAEPRTMEPALKLEEVGRKAAAPQVQAPAIQLGRSRERAADLSAVPQVARAVPGSSPAERLVDRGVPPSSYRAPAPLSYAKPGPSVSLDQPREVVRAAPKPVVETPIAPAARKESPAKLEISREKAKITGPLAGRKVTRSFVPQYPAWAQARGIEADVAIRFTVSPAGDVIDNAVIERTSGYPELDRLAMDAIKRWKFTRMAGSENQWGVITFRFLQD